MTHPFALAADLAARRAQQLYRARRTVDAPAGAETVLDGERLLNFCSNDYLGLAAHPEVVAALKRGADEYGVGSGASHLVSGHTRAHQALEEALAAFTGRPRALLFSTGYMANLAAVTALCGEQDAVFQDRLNHASLLDAGRLSGARAQRFLHADVDNLAVRLARSPARRRLVVTDGVFSMDGDVAPLAALAATARAHDGWLMVDDAHGFGVLGRGGRGCVDAAGLGINEVPVLVGTLGKAFGTFGAFVAGSDELIDYLVQFARPYIYTTALPPPVAVATLASLRLLEQDDWRRERLAQHVTQFRAATTALGYELMPSTTPIQPLLLGDATRALDLAAALRARGILATAIRPPTVPAGASRLRITFSAAHTPAQVQQLIDALAVLAPRFTTPA